MMKNKCMVEFAMDNAAFDDNAPAEAARMLRMIADSVEASMSSSFNAPIKDANGNRIGCFGFHYEHEGDE